MDMAHIPFYIAALGDDRKISVSSLLSSEGDTIEYVHDLGDWWRHKITCVQVHASPTPLAGGVADKKHNTFVVAEVLGGAICGPPTDIGGAWAFAYKLNTLLGCFDDEDTPVAKKVKGIQVTTPNKGSVDVSVGPTR